VTRDASQKASLAESRIGRVRGDNLKRESRWIGDDAFDDDRGTLRSAEYETQIDCYTHEIRRGLDGGHRGRVPLRRAARAAQR
jgi:hypothetical protein